MIVGVTGGMGAGKSLVSGLLGELLGVDVLSADILCRDLLQMTAVRTIILNSFTDVNELLKDGRLMKYQTRLVSDILSETSQIIRGCNYA